MKGLLIKYNNISLKKSRINKNEYLKINFL